MSVRPWIPSACLCLALWAVFSPASTGSAPLPTSQEEDIEALIEAERREADRLRRRGEHLSARRRLSELLEDEPEDALTRSLRALCDLDRARYEPALAGTQRAFESASELSASESGARAVRAECARHLARVLSELGRSGQALEVLRSVEDSLDPNGNSEDAWALGSALAQNGEHEGAERLFRMGASPRGGDGWRALLARARCERRLGMIERASHSLVAADRAARADEGVEPDVLVELGQLYFEADREVYEAKHRSAADLYREALEISPGHAGALLGLFELHRYNWMRRSKRAQDYLDELLMDRPEHVVGLVAGATADLDDGRLMEARKRLDTLRQLAPERRDVKTLEASLAWIENRKDDCNAKLEELARSDPRDSGPEREVGRNLLELYRFAEGLPFLRRAVERDPSDHRAWTQLGRALANTGDEEAALEALEEAERVAGLRQDAWRKNTKQVLGKMKLEHTELERADLDFSWSPEAGEVLSVYLVPFYEEARRELAERYGHTPGRTRIEVFAKHGNFSVRSTGFEGFPALGVCFGPVVTAVSPLAELRGSFSWARTSFHEFTHVVHLGLSHNRCPRWITEGLATWEEVNKNPAWTRNMRRDLIDARANDMIIPVRELNRAFRGPRILFGYYQGGLLCQMLIEQHGFAPMIRLLEAFDRGLDLDQAFQEVFHTTPEAVDRDFVAFVERELEGLSIEPRWAPETLAKLRLTLEREPPTDAEARERWADDWCTLAWGAWQSGRRIDAKEGLRQVHRSGSEPARAIFLEGEMALADDDVQTMRKDWQRALAGGAEDYRVRMALGEYAYQDGDLELAEEHFLAAEAAFPGFDNERLSAERRLAKLYFEQGRFEEEKQVLERLCKWESGDLDIHKKVAGWHYEAGRYEKAAAMLERANEIDPFLRYVHYDWGEALFQAGNYTDALREFEVAEKVPAELDAEQPGPLDDEARAELKGWQARCLKELGEVERAADLARAGLELFEDCESCALALEGMR